MKQEIKKQIAERKSIIADSEKKIDELNKQIAEAYLKEFLGYDENNISKLNWELWACVSNGPVIFSNDTSSFIKEFTEAMESCPEGLEISPGIKLYVKEGEISIHFDNGNRASEFVYYNKLRVSLERFNRDLSKLKDEVNDMTSLFSKFEGLDNSWSA